MNLYELTLKEASEKLKNKEVTSVELTQACIDRITATDEKLNALLAKDFDRALAQAEVVDKKIANGEELGILEGVPCTIKDIIVTEGIKTTAASKMLQNYTPLFNATVVEKLKDAGAIILGKNREL